MARHSTGMGRQKMKTEAEVKMLRNKYKAVPAKLLTSDLRFLFRLPTSIYGMPPGADCSL